MLSPIAAMTPPSQPNWSMASLQAETRSINSSGRDLSVPRVQIPAPAQIVGSIPHLSIPQAQIAAPAKIVGSIPHLSIPQARIPAPVQIVGSVPHIGTNVDKRA
ncbi:MAG: hypothetical protein JO247_11160 [Chloroflexi bacterium]|nr:hypothetical protein [Chloroflexota bacterium]